MKRGFRKTSQSSHGTMNELNITPLLDLAFVLLVIFIITTPQLANNLEMNLPSGQPPKASAEKPRVHNVVVLRDGTIFFDDSRVTLAPLRELLVKVKTNDPDSGVVVKGDTEVDYQKIIDVLDILQQLDITKVGLATENAVLAKPE